MDASTNLLNKWAHVKMQRSGQVAAWRRVFEENTTNWRSYGIQGTPEKEEGDKAVDWTNADPRHLLDELAEGMHKQPRSERNNPGHRQNGLMPQPGDCTGGTHYKQDAS
jgi:hypothetical protein